MYNFYSHFKNDIIPEEYLPGIYSVLEMKEKQNSYDGLFGDFYDLVACNPIYNRLVWGYSIRDFEVALEKNLKENRGPVLDAGCGSLAFTYRFYLNYSDRPVLFFDQSMKLLKKARKRLGPAGSKQNENKMILQADAYNLPFFEGSFDTLISMNLLHVLKDPVPFLKGIGAMVKPGGNFLFTTLLQTGNAGDSFLKRMEKAGEVYVRDPKEIRTILEAEGFSLDIDLKGNLAFIQAKR